MRRTLIFLLSLAALALPAGARALELSFLSWSADDAAAKKDDLYRAAKRDLDAKRWGQAIDKFGQVAQRGGSEADAALYWKAYAQNKAGRSQQALSTLKQLSGSHPKSQWIDDAKALEVEIRGTAGNGAASENEELKLYALSGLIASDPDRALPMLRKFLQGNHSRHLKEQALFVVSQGDSPEARKILLDVARGAAHPELQLKAIEYLGIAGGGEALNELYRGSNRSEVRRAVLNAYLIADQKDGLFAVAQNDKDPLRGEAINLLGAMGADKELRQLYRSESSPEVRRKVLEAMGIAGDVETLAEVARQEQNPSLRRQAIQGLGIHDSAKSAEALRSLYAASSDPGTRKAVLEALFIQSNARSLVEIYRAEKDREVRREIVRYLSLMDSKEAEDFLGKVFEN
ncbi:MAG TPA: HEAT repeat domain-containing protein [Thermoanaerobaculia bacterium]